MLVAVIILPIALMHPTGDLRPEDRRIPAPEAALEHFILPQGYAINCFASEQDFPELVNPTAMAFDAQGRLWVTVSATYPHVLPGAVPNDKILVLEDTNGDGRADRRTIFAEGLHLPTGFLLGHGGAYVVSQPNLLHLRDTDGDLRADDCRVVLHGFGSEDSHHSMSAFTWRPDGSMYFNEGTFHHTQIETPHGPRRLRNGGIIRYQPTTEEVEVVVSFPFANPWGHTLDAWGQSIISDASNGYNYRLPHLMGAHHYPDDMKSHGPFRGVRSFTPGGRRPSAGGVVLRSRHFPDEVQDRFITTQCIGFHGLRWYVLSEEGSGFTAQSQPRELLQSTDTSFRPIDVEVGPDGALYVLDWANPIVGHMQFGIRDPRRDRHHGRVWRVTYPSRALLHAPKIEDATIWQWLELLRAHELGTRSLARRKLQESDADLVLPVLKEWVAQLDSSDPEFERLEVEALWICQGLREVHAELLERSLTAADPRARAAGVRVLRWWQQDLPDAGVLLERAVLDSSPWVRLEALLALGQQRDVRAAELVGLASGQPMDAGLEVVFHRSLAALAPYGTPSGEGTRAWQLQQLNDAELISQPLDHFVARERLRRPGLDAGVRNEAACWWGEQSDRSPAIVLLQAARESGTSLVTLNELIDLLVERPVEELQTAREQLLATGRDPDQPALLRAGAWAAITRADGGFAQTLTAVHRSPDPEAARCHLLAGFPRLARQSPSPDLQKSVWAEAIATLPHSAAPRRSPRAQFVRISLPRPGTITLAEVEVKSDGRNVARGASTRQSSTMWEGDPDRAVDGDPDGIFARGTSTHTREDDAHPFWEVDLGRTVPIDTITIWGRSEPPFDQRLDGFDLELLDRDRRRVWSQENLPAPQFSVRLEPGYTWKWPLVDAALTAIAAMPGRERQALDLLIPLAETFPDGRVRRRAIELIQTIPSTAWRSEDERWRIQEIPITTIPDRMVYDRRDFEVLAGRPVRITLFNPDAMPHNLLVCRPGSMRRVGMAADNLGTGPDAVAQNYVPDIEDVLEVLPLVEPGETKSLLFLAPEQPGQYPYVCTIPGHWPMMNGTMTVKSH